MYKISLYYFSKFDFQNKKIKGNGGVLLKEREEKAKLTTNTHAHTTHSLRLLCCTICDIQNHVNKQKLQTRLLEDYSNQSRIHEGTSPGKQRTELWTKAQQNLLISFDFFLSRDGWNCGEKDSGGVADKFLLRLSISSPKSQSASNFTLLLPLLLLLICNF